MKAMATRTGYTHTHLLKILVIFLAPRTSISRLAPIAALLRNEPRPRFRPFFSARSRHYSNIGQAIFFGLMLWALASRCPHPSHRVTPAAGRVVPPAAGRTSFWFYAMTDRRRPWA
jgi:hypothetical protein